MVAMVAIKLFNVYVDYRQLLRYKDKKAHPYLESIVNEKEFAES